MRAIDTFKIKVCRAKETHSAKIMLYNSLEDLRLDAAEYDSKRTSNVSDYADTAGITHSFHAVRIDADGRLNGIRSQTNIVRMLKNVGMGVATHELAHVACHMFRVFLVDDEGNIGNVDLAGSDAGRDDYMEYEESFCHILSDLAYDFANKMVKHGHW